jgi:hypothetical protein
MRESTIEQYLVTETKKRKGYCIKLLGVVGLPDRMILLPGARVIFVEVKTITGRLSPLQKQWQIWLGVLGFKVLVLRSKDQVVNVFD